MEGESRRFVYAYALGTTGDLLVDLSCDTLTMADIDDLRSLFDVVEKTLRRVVQRRALAAHEAAKEPAAPEAESSP